MRHAEGLREVRKMSKPKCLLYVPFFVLSLTALSTVFSNKAEALQSDCLFTNIEVPQVAWNGDGTLTATGVTRDPVTNDNTQCDGLLVSMQNEITSQELGSATITNGQFTISNVPTDVQQTAQEQIINYTFQLVTTDGLTLYDRATGVLTIPPTTPTPTTGSYWTDEKVAQWFSIALAFFITGRIAYQFRFTRYD